MERGRWKVHVKHFAILRAQGPVEFARGAETESGVGLADFSPSPFDFGSFWAG